VGFEFFDKQGQQWPCFFLLTEVLYKAIKMMDNPKNRMII